ncbi:MAG: calcium-binding protein [Xenococcaceae cyanobacterium MO_188.B29]|nr:calcium-binding protein [Xenococcaceae cyanobacterium MO_188.B29]
MLDNISEKQMHRVRWLLIISWLLLIALMFYDPISPWLTEPHNTFSPFHKDPNVCIKLQGICIQEQPHSIAGQVFWAAIVPLGIIILLVFGHELWRRICPLSFVSQLPRALGIQRKQQRIDPHTGKVSYRLAKVPKNSWLARNYLYLQFSLLYLGICARILFVNTVGWVLALFLLLSIGLAILVGYLYDGKTWCNYFCPMAPVQKVYGEPRGLFASTAHESANNTITQSMCRIIDADGKEQSACVACQTPCIDIDAERTYWDGIKKPDRKLLYYGYIGLVFSFYFYYYLYAGNWDYYFSGAWTHEENLLSTLFNPGFYIFDTPIPIPKLVAVPLTLGFFTLASYWLGLKLEKAYKVYLRNKNRDISPEIIQHQLFTFCTFFVFNLFFVWGGRPTLRLMPLSVQFLFNTFVVLVSTLWLYRTWGRSPALYSRESLANRLRRQLSRLNLDVAHFLEGQSLEKLNPNEVYVLAKILPGFTREKRIQAYKGVLKESLEEGYVNSSSSLEVLQQMRMELDMSDRDHQQILTELGVENPSLFDPNKQRTREDLARLQGFRNRIKGLVKPKRRRTAKGLGRELLQVVKKEKSMADVFNEERQAIKSLSLEYSVTSEERAEILAELEETTDLTNQARQKSGK